MEVKVKTSANFVSNIFDKNDKEIFSETSSSSAKSTGEISNISFENIINECVNKHFNNNDSFKEEFNIVPLHFSSQHRFIRRVK